MSVAVKPPWTREEEERLRALVLRGKSAEEIAAQLKRTPKAIKTRALTLRLVLGKLKSKKWSANKFGTF